MSLENNELTNGGLTQDRVSRKDEGGDLSNSLSLLSLVEQVEEKEDGGDTDSVFCLTYGCSLKYRDGHTYDGSIAFFQDLGVVPHGNGNRSKEEGEDKVKTKNSKPETKRYVFGVEASCRIHEGYGYGCSCHFCNHSDCVYKPLDHRNNLCLCAEGHILNISKSALHTPLYACSDTCTDILSEFLEDITIAKVDDNRFIQYDQESKLTTIFCGGYRYKNSVHHTNVFDLEGTTELNSVPVRVVLMWKLDTSGYPIH
jgi:hypothetical protein